MGQILGLSPQFEPDPHLLSPTRPDPQEFTASPTRLDPHFCQPDPTRPAKNPARDITKVECSCARWNKRASRLPPPGWSSPVFVGRGGGGRCLAFLQEVFYSFQAKTGGCGTIWSRFPKLQCLRKENRPHYRMTPHLPDFLFFLGFIYCANTMSKSGSTIEI